MSEIGAPTSVGVPAQRGSVEMTAALDEESDRVALDTMRQMDAQLMMRSYEGFLK